MLSKGQAYFPYWLTEMKLCNLFCSIPYKWEDKSEQIVLIKKPARLIYPYTLFLQGMYLTTMCLHMYVNHSQLTLSNFLKGFVAISAYSTSFVTRLTFWIWEKEGLDLFNGFLRFEKQLIKQFPEMNPKLRKGELYTKVVFFLGTSTTSLFGFFIIIQLVVEPCTPPYMLSMTTPCLTGGGQGATKGVTTMIVILFFEGLIACVSFQPTALGLGNILLGHGMSLKKYLMVLQEEVKKIRGKTEMKRNAMELAVLCIFRYYCQIHLLVKQMNAMLKDLLIPGAVACCSNVVIFSLYVCIKLNGKISMPGFLFFPMMLMDALLVIGIDVAATSFVYYQSKCALKEWKNLERFKRKSVVRTAFRGLPLLKTRFGMNFVDELTSLTILNFSINQTVSLLLMT